jgi:hypothetical protein
MLPLRDARIIALRNNIQRYCRLLATHLTDVERAFIHRRLAEDRLAIEALEREAVAGSGRSQRRQARVLAEAYPLCLLLPSARRSDCRRD